MAPRVPQDPKSKGAAYTAAVGRLHAAHVDELQGYLEEEYKARGHVYKRRLTDEQKAAAKRAAEVEKAKSKVDQALGDYPELYEHLGLAKPTDEDEDLPEAAVV